MNFWVKIKEEIINDLDLFLEHIYLFFINLRNITFFEWVKIIICLIFFILQIKFLVYFILYCYWYFYKYFFLLFDSIVSSISSSEILFYYSRFRSYLDFICLDVIFIKIPEKINRFFKRIKLILSFSFFHNLLLRFLFFIDLRLERFFKLCLVKYDKYSYYFRQYTKKIKRYILLFFFYLRNKLLRSYIKNLSVIYLNYVSKWFVYTFIYFYKLFKFLLFRR